MTFPRPCWNLPNRSKSPPGAPKPQKPGPDLGSDLAKNCRVWNGQNRPQEPSNSLLSHSPSHSEPLWVWSPKICAPIETPLLALCRQSVLAVTSPSLQQQFSEQEITWWISALGINHEGGCSWSVSSFDSKTLPGSAHHSTFGPQGTLPQKPLRQPQRQPMGCICLGSKLVESVSIDRIRFKSSEADLFEHESSMTVSSAHAALASVGACPPCEQGPWEEKYAKHDLLPLLRSSSETPLR